jgi:hypothetical protein
VRAGPRANDLLLALLVLGLQDGLVTGRGVLFERDVHLMWATHLEVLARGVAAGSWPLWNPFIGFGQPLLADANVQALYPPTVLNLVVRPWTYASIYVVAHFAWAAFGLRRLARGIGLSSAGAVLAAAAWLCSGPLVSLAHTWNQLAGAAWMPWIVLACLRAVREPGRRPVLALAVQVAMPVLAGAPEMLAASLALGALLALRDPGGPPAKAPAWRSLLRLALGTVLGMGLSAAQALPSLAAAAGSGRAALTAEARAHWSVHPATLVQGVLPLPLRDWPWQTGWRDRFFDGRDPFLASLYLGAPALALAGVAVATGRRGPAPWLAAGAAGALLLALGRHAPVFAWASEAVPVLRLFRYPAKAMVPASMCVALLVGLGFEAWRRGTAPAAGRIAAVGLLAAAFGGLGTAAWLSFGADALGAAVLVLPAGLPAARAFAPAVHSLLVWAALAGACALLLRRGPRPGVPRLLGVLAAGDLLLAHAGLNPLAPRELYTARPPLLAHLAGSSGRLLALDYFAPGGATRARAEAAYLLARAPVGWPEKATHALGLRRALYPPTPGMLGVRGSFDLNVPGLEPPDLARLREVLWLAEGRPEWLRLLRLGAVGHVASLHEIPALPLVALDAGFFAEPVRLYAVPGAVPRAFVAHGVRVTERTEALPAMLEPGFDPHREVILESGTARPPETAFRGAARLLAENLQGLVLEVEASATAHLVLVDAFDAGWRARVDGRDAPVLRANSAFRAVPVPAGRHRVELTYWPALLGPGLVLSAGVILVAGLAAARRR